MKLSTLPGVKAKKAGLENIPLRRTVAYQEEKNTTIEIISSNLGWKASTVAELYRRRW